MSFAVSAAVIGGLTLVQNYTQGEEAKKRQDAAQQLARQQAETAARDADMAFNRANQKKPNVQGIMDQNKAAGMGGAGSTMLTGPMGIDPTLLTLGRNTLLGS